MTAASPAAQAPVTPIAVPPTAPPGPAPAPAAKAAKPAEIPKAVGWFRLRLRHFNLIAIFALVVILPTIVAAWYLFFVAERQYTSTVGFVVRSEQTQSALGLLGGLSGLTGGSTSSDTDILYHFIRSQDLVAKVDAKLDLRSIYAKVDYDPVFAFDPSGRIEDLTAYWGRMVKVFYDNATGLMELRVHAFDPQDAQRIAQAIFDESFLLVNELSASARADATRYAREDLDVATKRLSDARIALTEFRSRTQIVDPAANVQGQMGLLNSLQQQKAQAMIELNLLRDSTRPGDPRISEAERRIAVVDSMIADEKRKFGVGGETTSEDENYSDLVGEFERLTVEREFAERAYIAALTAYDNAVAEAQRKSRYLAVYIRPTLAEQALYPRSTLQTAIVFGFALLIWAIGALVYYSVRDRR